MFSFKGHLVLENAEPTLGVPIIFIPLFILFFLSTTGLGTVADGAGALVPMPLTFFLRN